MFMLQCSEVETKPNKFFVPSLDNRRLHSTFTPNTWCETVQGLWSQNLLDCHKR